MNDQSLKLRKKSPQNNVFQHTLTIVHISQCVNTMYFVHNLPQEKFSKLFLKKSHRDSRLFIILIITFAISLTNPKLYFSPMHSEFLILILILYFFIMLSDLQHMFKIHIFIKNWYLNNLNKRYIKIYFLNFSETSSCRNDQC